MPSRMEKRIHNRGLLWNIFKLLCLVSYHGEIQVFSCPGGEPTLPAGCSLVFIFAQCQSGKAFPTHASPLLPTAFALLST